jgi:hypothetical protein
LEHFNLFLLQDSPGLSFHFLLSIEFCFKFFVIVGNEFTGGAASLPFLLSSSRLALFD